MKNITVDEKIAKAAVLFQEPLEDYTPNDIREWLKKNTGDANLATAYAQVSNQVGWIGHEIDDPDNDTETERIIRARFDEWWALDKEIQQTIFARIEDYNKEHGTDYPTSGKGTHYLIEPFMNMNGYQDGCGWWIEDEKEAK